MANKQEEEITEIQEAPVETPAAEVPAEAAEVSADAPAEAKAAPVTTDAAAGETPARKGERGNRAQKVGLVYSDKMQKTCVVRVDRLIKHPRYRRYVRRRTNFMAHNEMGATIGDRVRIVETRPLSARKRWRVVEIIQKAAK
jgi:small subunit ribosomal protein S17